MINTTLPRMKPGKMVLNHIRISNLTELDTVGDQCKTILVEIGGATCGIIEPGQHWDIKLPHGISLKVRESTGLTHTHGQMVTENGITRASFVMEK